MNWLYPNFLRRIDHYLKINYPHVWRTRVHDFGWFSLVLGNVVLLAFGILSVRQNNLVSVGELFTIHIGLAVLFGFVSLFWVIHLLRFKVKFFKLRTMLTTWLIYALCVASLMLNLATLTLTIVYRTASLYPSEMIVTDYGYMNTEIKKIEGGVYYYDGEQYHLDSDSKVETYTYNSPGIYRDNYLKEEFQAAALLDIIARYSHSCEGCLIPKWQVNEVENKLYILREAQIFKQKPGIGTYRNRYDLSFYHKSLRANWIVGVSLIVFLPLLLFMLSVFGLKNMLISAFIATLITGFMVFWEGGMGMETDYYYTARHIMEGYGIVFLLGVLMVVMEEYRHYFKKAFVLALGTMMFISFIMVIKYYMTFDMFVLFDGRVLPIALILSFIAAWLIVHLNNQPDLQ